MRLKIVAAAFIGTILGTSTPALAVCEGADGVISTLACLDQEYAVADANLNAAWSWVMRDHLSGGDRDVHKEEIRASQRAWLKFRDADCEARSKIGIPKYWQVNKMWCLYEMTKERTAKLKEVYVE